MSEPVIPNAVIEHPASPAVVALRKEISLLQNAVFALGNSTIRAKEGQQAHELLAYLDNLAAVKIQECESLVASEILGQPVKAEGTKISPVEH